MQILRLCLLLSGASVLLSGCAKSLNNGLHCEGWSAIRPQAADISCLSDDLVEQILKHNSHGEVRCGWTK